MFHRCARACREAVHFHLQLVVLSVSLSVNGCWRRGSLLTCGAALKQQ
jgi:hypothetical protein